MSLKKYVAKRDFTKTTEPKAGKNTDDKLKFVIQKHAASRLHYDFRLEMEGVLKSWAVPKGPSTDPKTRRLAMMVEDHPYDYRTFEGIIPEGEYGGGTVIVWDEGNYEPLENIKGKKAQEKHLLKQLKEGSLKIRLQGKKLQGEFALVRTHGMGENAWLLIKHKDEFASADDITLKDKSVVSGKTLEKVKETTDKVWKSNHEETVTPSGKTGKKKVAEATVKTIKKEDLSFLKRGTKSKIPRGVTPMLATLVDEPFDDPEWLYEVKWDGYRTLAIIDKGEVKLLSRNNKSFDDKFYPIFQLLRQWKINVVLDGEIIVLNEKGISDFGHLQNWRSEADGDLVFYVFDILWYDGKSLMELPLFQRQAVLEQILPVDDDRIRLSKVFKTDGIKFLAAAERMGLEGIIAKKADSTYSPYSRSR